MRISFLLLILFLGNSAYAEIWPKTKQDCLAANIYFEARGESLVGQYMVAFVTMNRVKSSDYPNNICEVVKQSKQFSWFNPNKEQFPHDRDAWNSACSITAKFILNKPSTRIDLSEGALFYHADYVFPKWRKDKTYITTVGGHIFYR